MFSILKFEDVDPSLWPNCFAFYEQIFRESYPYREYLEIGPFSKNLSPFETFAKRLCGFIVSDQSKMVACCHFRVDKEKRIITSEVKFLQNSFDTPLAEYMKHALLVECRAQSIGDLQMVVEHHRVLSHYLASGQFRKVGEVVESVLDLGSLDHDLLNSWLLPNPVYEIRKIQWADIAEAQAFTALYNETNEDVPFQDAKGMIKRRSLEYFIERAAQSIVQQLPWIAYGLYEQKLLVGVALFEGRMNNPKCMYIEFTGIRRDFRERGLGKHLKAVTTLELMKEIPSLRYLITGNEETNAPMLQINRHMGFVPRSEFSMLRHIGSKEF